MANKVSSYPPIPSPIILDTISSVQDYLTSLVLTLTAELQTHATRLNVAEMGDGSEAASGPVILKTYVKAALPSAVKYVNGMIVVSDDVGGLTPAFSDGTNWRRVADRNVIS